MFTAKTVAGSSKSIHLSLKVLQGEPLPGHGAFSGYHEVKRMALSKARDTVT